jgi:hypothetical protein
LVLKVFLGAGASFLGAMPIFSNWALAWLSKALGLAGFNIRGLAPPCILGLGCIREPVAPNLGSERCFVRACLSPANLPAAIINPLSNNKSMLSYLSPVYFLPAWSCLQYLSRDKELFIRCSVTADLLRIEDSKHQVDISIPLIEGETVEIGSFIYPATGIPKITLKTKDLDTDTKVVLTETSISIGSYTIQIIPVVTSVSFPEHESYKSLDSEDSEYLSTKYYLSHFLSIAAKLPSSEWMYSPAQKKIVSCSDQRVTMVDCEFWPISTTSSFEPNLSLLKNVAKYFDCFDKDADNNRLVFLDPESKFTISLFFKLSTVPLETVEMIKYILGTAQKQTPNFQVNTTLVKELINDVKLVKDQIDAEYKAVALELDSKEKKVLLSSYKGLAKSGSIESVTVTGIEEESILAPIYLVCPDFLLSLESCLTKLLPSATIQFWPEANLVSVESQLVHNYLMPLLIQ